MSLLKWRLGGAIAAAITLALSVGCGGSGSNNNVPLTPLPSIQFGGQVASYSAPSQTTVTASAAPQPVTVTNPNSGTTETVWIPAGVSVTAGQSLYVIPANVLLIPNMQNGNGLNGNNPPSVAHPAQGSAGSNILINGEPSGVLFINGELNLNIGFPPGIYTAVLTGPFVVTGNGSPTAQRSQLNVGQFIFKFRTDGIQASLPTMWTGTIPTDGSDIFGSDLFVTYPAAFASGTVTVIVTDGNGVVKQLDPVPGVPLFNSATGQTITPPPNGTIFHDVFNTGGARHIPKNGIDSFEVDYVP